MELDLTSLNWTLIGWQPNTWAWMPPATLLALDNDALKQVCVPEIPARVPGSVQDDLCRAGLLPDWNEGLNPLLCEWVEHRHWEYRCRVQIPAEWAGERILLVAQGLDYQGAIMVDCKVVASFRGMLTPHAFDLTDVLQPGQEQTLSVVLEEAPHEQGQIGFTSRSHFFKARYPYVWDWSPRMVPLGIWDGLRLQTVGATQLYGCLPYADYDPDTDTGSLSFRLDVETPQPAAMSCRVRVLDGERVAADETVRCAFAPGRSETTFAFPKPVDVEPWWPNGMGAQKLYTVTLDLMDGEGKTLDGWQGRVGFRRVRWLPCEGAPANAEPWICEVNGRTVFLQGINWVPVRITYGSVTPEMYRQRLELYADMGLNILRVWGGGVLEKEAFYNLCDELGLFVWQEFPLSSSGGENTPPDDPVVLAELGAIAASYIWRRGGHASLLIWCGGNELTEHDGCNTPINASHPAIARMAGVSAHLAPYTRFVVTSSSGPCFSYQSERRGMGLHHDIHGPWNIATTLDDWKAHWDEHDALFVAEVGAPSCSPVGILRRYAGNLELWPPTLDNPAWGQRSSWWVLWDHFAEEHGFSRDREELARFVEVTQQEQAEALSYMVASCKQRFPCCGGVILWMGHDCYPCPTNTAIVDFDGQPKPAAIALKKVFRG